MAEPTLLHTVVFRDILLPFLLIFFILFAILEKTKLLGENKQINALVSFVVGLIFVVAVYPTGIVSNLVLFLSIAIVVIFVFLVIYGFAAADSKDALKFPSGVKWTMFGLAAVATLVAVVWATGYSIGVFEVFFYQPWSEAFWTNFLFIAIIGVALAVVIGKKATKKD